MLEIVKYDYHGIMLHEAIKHVYSNPKILFTPFEIKRAIHEKTDRINDENAIELMKFSIQNDKKRERMLYYTQMILIRKFNIVFIEGKRPMSLL